MAMMTNNIFLKILSGEIPAKIAHEDDLCVAFHDVNPQAPVHLLIIPRKVIRTHADVDPDDALLLGHIHIVAAKLAKELVAEGFTVSDDTVGRLLKRLGFSLQAPSKSKELTNHPDRNAQFEYLNAASAGFVADGQPVISVDTKKKLRHEVARSERTRRGEVRPMPAV